MVYLNNVCLSPDTRLLTLKCKDGIPDKNGDRFCSLSNSSKQPFVLLEFIELVESNVVNRGYKTSFGRYYKGSVEPEWAFAPAMLKELVADEPKLLAWIFTLYLNTEPRFLEKYKKLSFEELSEKYRGFYEVYDKVGEFRTRKVERYWDAKGNMKDEFTCFHYTDDLLSEDAINLEFRYQGHRVVDDQGTVVPVRDRRVKPDHFSNP